MSAAPTWVHQLHTATANATATAIWYQAMTRSQADFYRRIPSSTTVYESSNMIAPFTPEALHERKVAIREGRLVIYDEQDPQRTPAGRCTGCGGNVPILRYPDTYAGSEAGKDNPMGPASPPTVPSGSFGHRVSAPFVTFTDTGSGAAATFTLDYIDVATASGSCKVEGSDCVQSQQCGAVVSLTFSAIFILANGAFVTPPTVQIRDPVTGLFTALMTHDPTTLRQEDGITQCEYEYVFSISMDCDDEWIYRFSMAQTAGTLSPTPGAGSWSNQVADSTFEFSLVLGCGRCVMGTGPEPVGG